MSVRLRFAPSPTGSLHVGNVRTALYNWLYARRRGGVLVLRIEDTDQERSERRFESQLIDDLRWLGLNWDEGVDLGGDSGPYRQSDRADLYRRHGEQLLDQGKAYRCFCSQALLDADRASQMAAGRQPHYVGRCQGIPPAEARRRFEEGESATLRLRVRSGLVGFQDMVFGAMQVECSTIGDFIILRSDGSAQYNFAVVVDDSLMRISHVIRGEGHLTNTHRQLLIYEAFGLTPPRFAHLSTILGRDGAKLSKRHGSTSIEEFRRLGYLPAALVNYLALLGWSPGGEEREVLSVEELVSEFDLSQVKKSPAVFDSEKLNWVNRSHMKALSPGEVGLEIAPYLQESGWLPGTISDEVREWLAMVSEAVLKYLDRWDQAVEACRVIFEFDASRAFEEEEVRQALSSPGAWEVVEELERQLSGVGEVDLAHYKEAVQAVKAATGAKGRDLFHPIRLALTARASGLELDRLVPILEAARNLNLPTPVVGIRERVRAILDCRR